MRRFNVFLSGCRRSRPKLPFLPPSSSETLKRLRFYESYEAQAGKTARKHLSCYVSTVAQKSTNAFFSVAFSHGYASGRKVSRKRAYCYVATLRVRTIYARNAKLLALNRQICLIRSDSAASEIFHNRQRLARSQ
jgi:hypothetical protein